MKEDLFPDFQSFVILILWRKDGGWSVSLTFEHKRSGELNYMVEWAKTTAW